ncbi:hypothetical protein [Polaribacter sp.]|uniref:helix-turn-helix transcriptional regulator n=1 Tax=Polaribacter sp. TaxID=1920175 RepID=UPI003EFAF704
MKRLQALKRIITLLILFQVSSYFSQDLLIKNEDSWHYYDDDYLENDWIQQSEFSNWKFGKSPLGYGSDQINTVLNFGDNKEQKHITKYFKKKLVIQNTYVAYQFKILSDDGAMVYINGKELIRENMPNSSIGNTTLAASTIKGEAEHLFKEYYFDNSIFNEGENTISISVHQVHTYSSDCIFSLELIGHHNPEVLKSVIDDHNKSNQELKYRIKDLNTKFEFEKISVQKERLEDTNFYLRILLYLFCFLGVLLVLGYYFILEYSKKNKKELELKQITLSAKILEKDKEMITLSTNILHNKQYFKEIKADLKGIKTDEKGIIKGIIKQIDYVLERDDDWHILKEHFNAVYDNFYDKLNEKHPTLSETELRHCMFIKLHMHTKEIARILLIDPRSVQTGRYRIKKKMNLNENEDLRDYLLKFI